MGFKLPNVSISDHAVRKKIIPETKKSKRMPSDSTNINRAVNIND